jgi:hypothetical protein
MNPSSEIHKDTGLGERHGDFAARALDEAWLADGYEGTARRRTGALEQQTQSAGSELCSRLFIH